MLGWRGPVSCFGVNSDLGGGLIITECGVWAGDQTPLHALTAPCGQYDHISRLTPRIISPVQWSRLAAIMGMIIFILSADGRD